jgi:hypothetical protein
LTGITFFVERPMPKLTDDLVTLHTRFVGQRSEDMRDRCGKMDREHTHKLRLLAKQKVVTVANLISRLPQLSLSAKRFGIWLISVLKVRQAVSVLLGLMSDRAVRSECAHALYMLKADAKVTRVFMEIGHRELRSENPDHHWLDAVIIGLGSSDDPRAVELLVTIFERADLPGWIRGDAGDKLGCAWLVRDRRTRLFRRCRAAALRGLTDESIDVQFWSMYVIASLASKKMSPRRSSDDEFAAALPVLRQIVASDHRLAPGFWWSMSAEAEDAIGCIETGRWPQPDAAERWAGNTERGVWNRD